MDEHVPATHLPQEIELDAVIEKRNEIARRLPGQRENGAQTGMHDHLAPAEPRESHQRRNDSEQHHAEQDATPCLIRPDAQPACCLCWKTPMASCVRFAAGTRQPRNGSGRCLHQGYRHRSVSGPAQLSPLPRHDFGRCMNINAMSSWSFRRIEA